MDYHFVRASNGDIPVGAQPNGQEADGTPLYVARTYGYLLQNAGIPGKVRLEFGGALVPFGGKENLVVDYDVLMEAGIWVSNLGLPGDAGSGGAIPFGAVVCGADENGPLFIARAQYNGGVHPGKLGFGYPGASIGWGGREIFVPVYEVLVSQIGLYVG